METYGRMAPLKLVRLRRFVNEGPVPMSGQADPLRRFKRRHEGTFSETLRRLELCERLRRSTRWERQENAPEV